MAVLVPFDVLLLQQDPAIAWLAVIAINVKAAIADANSLDFVLCFVIDSLLFFACAPAERNTLRTCHLVTSIHLGCLPFDPGAQRGANKQLNGKTST